MKDVRPGDVIDYSWSLDGANPLLGGRYTDEYDLSSAVPSRRIRHRLLWPRAARCNGAARDPSIVERRRTTLLVGAKDVPALDVEDSIPSWYEPWKSVQVTEFASWSEVAQWAEAMFRLDARSLPR